MPDNTRKSEILTGLTILALTLGLFFAGEIALRMLQWLKFGQQESVENSSAYFIDEATGLRLNVANRTLGDIRINNLGFRGPDITVPKPSGTFRLAFLGASVTYDPYSPEGENWPHLVSEVLGRRVGDCEIDYVNAGKPGYDMKSIADLYTHFVVGTDPDMVIVMTGGLSSALEWYGAQQGFDTDHTSYRSTFNKYSLLLQKLEKNVRVIKLARSARSRSGKLAVDVDILTRRLRQDLVLLLDKINDAQRLIGIVTLGGKMSDNMAWDELVAAGNTQLYYMPHVYLSDVVVLRNAFNLSIPEALAGFRAITIADEGRIPSSSVYYKDSAHFTPAGSAAMAARVADQLLGSQEFRSLLSERGCSVF
ncbi:MAG: lysophospholipase L1-like esterase [Halioglobus sp.]|jgi:lysophospholipase L1-like esterase